MTIDSVTIKNYRNLDGIYVKFNPEYNFIIGENNLGKSNFLTLLSTVCNGKSVDMQDFFDVEKPIEVELNVKLNQAELGFFGDNFSPEDSSSLKILYRQTVEDFYPSFNFIDSNESFNRKQMRKLNFLRYETTSIPSKELQLDTRKGTGLLMSSLIDHYNEGKDLSFLNGNQIEELSNFINQHLSKIRCFQDFSIKATIASNPTEMLTSLFYLSDGERKIETTGNGIQYMAMATINILCQIMALYKGKAVPFSDLLYTDESRGKILPIILSIDEPEVHLHPYLQRSLIGYYKKILSNGDSEFLELLKDCFDIDGIDGQLIVVTHSTDALAGDYRNLIRFYKKKNEKSTAAVSGYALRPIPGQDNSGCIKAENEKHLIMHFPEIKEAFYAKCAILIEGETEYGCIHAFAEKIGVSLDDCGICVINAQGQSSIEPIRQLLDIFAVPSIAIYDRDDKSECPTDPNKFYTSELCFEIEIIKMMLSSKNTTLVRKIALELDPQAEDFEMDVDFVKKPFKKMNIDTSGYVPKKLSDVDDANEEEFCNMYSTWFMAKKGVLLGRIIGDNITKDDIPSCYRDAILRAQKVAASV